MLVRPEHFHFNIKNIKPREARLALSDVRAYQRRTRERDLRGRRPLETALDYVKREYDFAAAQAEVGYHTVWLNGYGGLPDELFADVDRMARTKLGAYTNYGGHAPRLGSFITGSIPYGVTLAQSKAALDLFLIGLGQEFGVASEAVIHLKKDRPDHFHAVVTDRMVSAAGVGAKQRRFNAISQKAAGVGVISGENLLCEATVHMRDAWAALMSAASGREISAASFSSRGLGIEPVKYVSRRDIMDQERDGREDWRSERAAELAARERTLAVQSKLLEPNRQAVHRRRSKAALRAAVGFEATNPKIVLPMRPVQERLDTEAAKRIDGTSVGGVVMIPAAETSELVDASIEFFGPPIEVARRQCAKVDRARRRKAALLSHITANASLSPSPGSIEISFSEKQKHKPFNPQSVLDPSRDLLTLFLKKVGGKPAKQLERRPAPTLLLEQPSAFDAAVDHHRVYRDRLNERRKRRRLNAIRAAEAAEYLTERSHATARYSAKDEERLDRACPMAFTPEAESVVIKPTLPKIAEERRTSEPMQVDHAWVASRRNVRTKQRWGRGSVAITQSIPAGFTGVRPDLKHLSIHERADEHFVYAVSRNTGPSNSGAGAPNVGEAAVRPTHKVVDQVTCRGAKAPSVTTLVHDHNAEASSNMEGLREVPAPRDFGASLQSHVMMLAADWFAKTIRFVGGGNVASLDADEGAKARARSELPSAKRIEPDKASRSKPQIASTKAAAKQAPQASTMLSGPSAVDLASRYAVAIMRSGTFAAETKTALAVAVHLDLAHFEYETKCQTATCRSTDPKPSIEKRRVAKLATMLGYEDLSQAIKFIETANKSRVSLGASGVGRLKQEDAKNTKTGRNLLDN